MKTTILAASLLVVLSVQAQPVDRPYFGDFRQYGQLSGVAAQQAFLAALHSENDGVLESALAHAAMVGLLRPSNDYGRVQQRVAAIARSAASPELRYKAYLTATVLEDPGIFRGLGSEGYTTADEFFGALASRLAVSSTAR